MEEKMSINEEVLSSWLRLTMTISNEKLVSDMPFNEALVCHILYRNQEKDPNHLLTATDLCKETKILKSQMNRTLTSMENRRLIIRRRSQDDKRQIFVELNKDEMGLYISQHTKILQLVEAMVQRYGEDKIKDVIQLFEEIADIAEEVI